jgi:hypothetical protein
VSCVLQHALKTDNVLRGAVFSTCFLPLSRLSAVAHRECLRLLQACVDCLTAEESLSFVQQLQREGCRAELVAAPAPTPAAATPADTSSSASAPPLAPTNALASQIASVLIASIYLCFNGDFFCVLSLTGCVVYVPLVFCFCSTLYQQLQSAHPQLFKQAKRH